MAKNQVEKTGKNKLVRLNVTQAEVPQWAIDRLDRCAASCGLSRGQFVSAMVEDGMSDAAYLQERMASYFIGKIRLAMGKDPSPHGSVSAEGGGK